MNRVLTVDLEYDFETKSTSSFEVLPKLLDFFDNHDIKSTFFVLGEIAEKYEDLIKSIPRKHEIASHSYNHKYLNTLTDDELEFEIKKSKDVLGKNCVGFRAPYFVTNKKMFPLLKKYGYKYDSSIASFFPGRYFNLLTKTKPFVYNGIVEAPIPNFMPKTMSAGLSYYRLFYPFSKLFKVPYMFYLHPCEFIDKKPGKEINYLVRKVYSAKTSKSWQIFEELISKLDCNFVTCKDYLKSQNLLE